jgi:general secretion pathway protein D
MARNNRIHYYREHCCSHILSMFSVRSVVNYIFWLGILFLALMPHFSSAQTIAEKKSGIFEPGQEMTQEMRQKLVHLNQEIRKDKEELSLLYAQVDQLFQQHAPPEAYQELLAKINQTRADIEAQEINWREMSTTGFGAEEYALWHQPETTIGQLVMDYGSHDYVYLLTPEIAGIRVSIDSNLPIPRASWDEMLDLILTQNGVSVRQLNPFLRQLILLNESRAGLRLITNQRRELQLFPPEARVCFVLTPEPAEVRRSWTFLEKFVNQKSTLLQQIGRDILIVGQTAEVQDLLKLYDFIATNKAGKEYRIFPIFRVDTEEMAKILAAIFDQSSSAPESSKSLLELKEKSPFPPQRPKAPPMFKPERHETGEVNGLKVIALSHVARALFLIGTKEEIHKAEQIIRQVESQVGEARERVIYWYKVKHSDPEELADVLFRIYILMLQKGVGMEEEPEGPPSPIQLAPIPSPRDIANEIVTKERDLLPSELYQTSYYQQGNYVVNPAPIEPRGTRAPRVTNDRDNFIVDPKTGSIAMVVEADILVKIKELIHKLDVPKQMVQIETLLFERRVTRDDDFGLNLLKIGDCADNVNFTCFDFSSPLGGLVDFIISRKKTCTMPAFDATYRFLMTQDDIQINASPSVIAINQTPATIAIVEEISIDTGIYNVETAKGITLERAFTRAQYGITIDITPTIHMTDDQDEPDYITLETDLTFDTITPGLAPNRPDVTRRHITNDVRIPDGQTVILGGLRRKITDDFRESIPFFGELPAVGKFFSFRELSDTETEMFIFLTPTIISNPLDDFERIKCEEMRRRPGDIPEFLCRLVAARDREKDRLLAGSMNILFGFPPDRCYSPGYWRPSTCGDIVIPGPWTEESYPGCNEYCGEYDGS